MGMELKRSFLPEKLVRDKIHQSYEGFQAVTGRKPNEKERENLKNKVIEVAKRVEKDRGVK